MNRRGETWIYGSFLWTIYKSHNNLGAQLMSEYEK